MMNKILFFKRGDRTLTPKSSLFLLVKNGGKEEGFSILEVLVTILVITGFILGSLQATVLATFMRVQAQDKQEATNWVQQDLELIRYQAFILDSGGVDNATCDNLNAVASTTSGAYGDKLENTLNPSTSPPFPTSEDITINGNRDYSVTRTYDHLYDHDNDTSTAEVHSHILGITYSISYASTHPRYKSGGDNEVTTLSTEVLPNAALACN